MTGKGSARRPTNAEAYGSQFDVIFRKKTMSEWQKIETAPKDQVILLGLPMVGNIKEWDRRVYEGRWNEDQSTWTSVNGFIVLSVATHWMPLPPPPKEQQ